MISVTLGHVADLRVAIMMTLARISGYVTSVATALAAAAIANAATGPVCAPCVQASVQHIVQRISDQHCAQLALHTGQAVAISADSKLQYACSITTTCIK
jgi:hypothetical protein